jgi:hypothetical protein
MQVDAAIFPHQQLAILLPRSISYRLKTISAEPGLAFRAKPDSTNPNPES